MSKPSFVFIPGSYSLLTVYQPLIDGISNAGYEIKGIPLPTIGLSSREGREGTAPSMYDDAAVIAEQAEILADQGKDVILLGHSYAGIPIAQSTNGLAKEQRKAQGKRGGVVRLAYIACLVPALGQSAVSLMSGLPGNQKPPIAIDENGWMLMEDPARTAELICQELPPETGEAIVRGFAKHSALSFANELTHAGYKDIAVSYLLCEDDMAGPAPFQRGMIAMIEEVSQRKVDVTSIKAGHCPNLTAERETIEWALKVAEISEQI